MMMSIHPHTPVPDTAQSQAAPGTHLVPVRPRCDGWTPRKQLEFLELLADTGSVREAASRVGMTEQSATRLRRRPDAAAFSEAWRAALLARLDTLGDVMLDRAVHGAIRRRYWRGELVGEERVPSDRLLIWLMTSGRATVERHDARRARREARTWRHALEAVEHPAPPGEPLGGYRVWLGPHGYPLTNLPPGPDFDADDWHHGRPGDPDYERCLSDAEKDAWFAWEARRDEVETAAASDPGEEARIRFFEALRGGPGDSARGTPNL